MDQVCLLQKYSLFNYAKALTLKSTRIVFCTVGNMLQMLCVGWTWFCCTYIRLVVRTNSTTRQFQFFTQLQDSIVLLLHYLVRKKNSAAWSHTLLFVQMLIQHLYASRSRRKKLYFQGCKVHSRRAAAIKCVLRSTADASKIKFVAALKVYLCLN